MNDEDFAAWREETNRKVREIDRAIEILQKLKNMFLSEGYVPGVRGVATYQEWKPMKWDGEK
jgi:hypothetical protein